MKMNKNFKQKIKEGNLKEYLNEIYERVCCLHANLGFLNTYCNAYSHLDGVYYCVPITEDMMITIEKTAIQLQELLGIESGVEDKSCFLDPVFSINNKKK